MYLTYRQAQPKDFEKGFSLISDRFAFSKAEKARLFSFWRYLLKGRMIRAVTVEDRGQPPEQRVVSFAMSLFVTDEFAQEAKTSLPPPLSYQVFTRWLKGKRVFLDSREIARHNSTTGLNLMVIHHGWRQGALDEVMEIRGKMLETFFLFHSGYRINEYFQNVFGEEEKAAMLGQGFRLLKDYGDQQAEWPPIYLTGANREKPNSSDNSFIYSLFRAPDPRFSLTPGEKDVLEKALLGETDQEIGKSLHFSVWAVKKRWQGIYGKVEATDPQALGKVLDKEQKIERRRYMLDYLRQHLEEIRPTLPARRLARTRRR